MPKLLTARKTAWVKRFRPDVVRGKPLNAPVAVESRYYHALIPLIHRMTEETEKRIVRLFNGEAGEEYFGEDASIASQARILTNALKSKYDRLFGDRAPAMAESFMEQTNRASSASVHMSIQQLSGGLSIPTAALGKASKEILKASIAENVGLIKSISSKYHEQVQGAVMRSITTGRGLQDLVPFLNKHKGITIRRARFIAMDQTRKAFNALSEGRLESAGVKRGEWLHTGGSNHPRPTHIAMTGEIYVLSEGLYDKDVGRKVKPGELPGCRCRFVPVLEFKGE